MTDQHTPQQIQRDDTTPGQETGPDSIAPAEDKVFDPSGVEASRTREQGNGVGQRELERQGDPGGVDPEGGDHTARDGEDVG